MESVDKWDQRNPSSVDTIPTVVWPLPDQKTNTNVSQITEIPLYATQG